MYHCFCRCVLVEVSVHCLLFLDFSFILVTVVSLQYPSSAPALSLVQYFKFSAVILTLFMCFEVLLSYYLAVYSLHMSLVFTAHSLVLAFLGFLLFTILLTLL